MGETLDQLRDIVDAALIRFRDAGFRFNGKVRHVRTGNVYEVLGMVLQESTLEACVVYAEDWVNWSRPLGEFLERFEVVE